MAGIAVRGLLPPETGTTHWASSPRAAPPHSWHPHTHPTSPRHLTDWNDSGSVLKFLGTHRRHSERLRALPPRGRAPSTSLEPTAGASRKRRVRGASLARAPGSDPACVQRSPRGPGVSPSTSSPENALIHSFQAFEPGGKLATTLHPHRRPSQSRAAGFNFRPPVPARASVGPKPAPGHARAVLGRRARCHPRRPGLPRPLPPLLSSPRQPGLRWEGALGACHPPPSVPDDAGGPGAFTPAPAGSRTRLCACCGERGRAATGAPSHRSPGPP